MSRWSQYRMRDVMSRIDLSLVSEDIPEGDLENPEFLEKYRLKQEEGLSEKTSRWKKIACASGVAAGFLILAGAVCILSRKNGLNLTKKQGGPD